MSYKIIGCVAGALCLGPAVAQASGVIGSFVGVMSDGTDSTGVFGADGGDLSNDAITGSFSYNTDLFSQSVSGGTNIATGTGVGALTVTITINGINHTFTDQTSSSIFLDDGSVSGNAEMTLNTLNQQGSDDESFTLDAQDPLNSFITGTGLVQSFVESPFISDGTFQILDTGPTVAAGGGFTIETLTLNGASSVIPEPASAALLLSGIAGMVGIAARRRRSVMAG